MINGNIIPIPWVNVMVNGKPVTVTAGRRYFYEYLYATAIVQHNRKNPNDMIRTREARQLHDDLFNKVRDKGFDVQGLDKINTVNPNDFIAAINEMFLNRTGVSPYADNSFYEKQYNTFRNIMPMFVDTTNNTTVYLSPVRPDGLPQEYYIPISPYDERFRDRETVLCNGAKVSYINIEECIGELQNTPNASLDTISSPEFGSDVKVYDNFDLFGNISNAPRQSGEQNRRNNERSSGDIRFRSQCDKYGIARLIPYMTNDEYENVYQWFLDGQTEQAESQSKSSEYQANIDKVVAMLDMLNDESIEYHIEKDSQPGQIKAVLDDYGVEIRLTERTGSEPYIGRIYSGGMVATFGTTLKDTYKNFAKNGINIAVPKGQAETNTTTAPYMNATPEDCKNLLKFVLNMPIEDKLSSSQPKFATKMQNGQLVYDMPNIVYTNNASLPQGQKRLVGQPYVYTVNSIRQRGYKFKRTAIPFNASTHNGKGALIVAYKPLDYGMLHSSGVVTMRLDASKSANRNIADKFVNRVDADNFISAAVNSARQQFYTALNIEQLLSEFEQHKGEDYTPSFNGDEDIAVMQKEYWAFLNGEIEHLQKPSKETDLFNETLEGDISATYYSYFDDDGNVLSESDIIKKHALDFVDYYIGKEYIIGRDLSNIDTLFHLTHTAKWQLSDSNAYRNTDRMISALRTLGVESKQIAGDDFYSTSLKDRLIRFDESTAKSMFDETQSDFIKEMGAVVKESLQMSGYTVSNNDIIIDKNGIVRYKARFWQKQEYKPCEFDQYPDAKQQGEEMARAYMTYLSTRRYEGDGNKSVFSEENYVTGEIGQIFDINSDGTFVSKFSSSKNHLYVPGYELNVVPYSQQNQGNVFARTRVKGYKQKLIDAIRFQIKRDSLQISNDVTTCGTPTNINNVYHRLYTERHDVDYIDKMKELGAEESFVQTIIDTETKRGHYPKSIRIGSTIHADFNYATLNRWDKMNDNFNDPYFLTGCVNMALSDERSDGYFDPVNIGTEDGQGMNRHIVGEIQPDGSIKPVASSGDTPPKDPLRSAEFMKFSEFDPVDRQQMTISNLNHCYAVSQPVGIAHMCFGGWNMDDGIVISKEFAESYKMRTADGKTRPLVVGDKLSDLHGNKGTIALIIDRNMSKEDAESKGIWNEVKWFNANEKLDVVMAPFPPVSRFCAGTARECMENPMDLYTPVETNNGIVKGEKHESSIGQIRMIITDKSADAKTHVYDDDSVRQGKGRKASSQLSWIWCSQNCKHIMNEIYGSNIGSVENLREYLIACGLDIDETGNFHQGYKPHQGENRNVFEIPPIEYNNPNGIVASVRDAINNSRVQKAENKIPNLVRINECYNAKAMSDRFKQIMAQSGGFLNIPFNLNYPTVVDGHTVFNKGAAMNSVPILSSHLRTGQEFNDGSVTAHDYTNRYAKIFECAVKYNLYSDALASGILDDTANSKIIAAKKAVENERQKCITDAQAAYNHIAGDIIKRRFNDSKHNIFRDEIMSVRMPNSATAICTQNPKLPIDEIAISRTIADTLGLKDGEYTIIWRDPTLHDGNVRYMRCRIDDNITGIAMAPQMDKSFDADFDGDTFALLKLHTKQAQKEAMAKLTIQANLLDKGSVAQTIDGVDYYDLYMQDSLDIKVAKHINPDFVKRWEKITKDVNDMERKYENGEISYIMVSDLRKTAMKEINQYYQDVFSTVCGVGAVSYKDVQTHLQSVKEICLDTGAKGNMSKMRDYVKYFGINCQYDDNGDFILDENGCIDEKSFEVHEHTLATREDAKAVQMATAIKKSGTGLAGGYSQRGMKAFRNTCARAVLETTYPVTQAVLQVKHDPQKAKKLYTMLKGPVRELWRGNKLEYDEKQRTWKTVRDVMGEIVQATREEWVKQFISIYTSPDGLDVKINPKYVEIIADNMGGKNPTDTMGNIEFDVAKFSATMDVLAYGGSFNDIYKAAKQESNLYREYKDGAMTTTYNELYSPNKITENVKKSIESEITGETASYNGFAKSDTKKKSDTKETPVSMQTPDFSYDPLLAEQGTYFDFTGNMLLGEPDSSWFGVAPF